MIEQPLYIYVDESGTDTNSDVFLLAVVITEQPESIREKIGQSLEKVKRDPEQKRFIGVKEAKSFHYTEDHFEIRNYLTEYILPGLEFDAYVSFIRKNEVSSAGDLPDLIAKALKVLVLSRIQTNHYREINFVYEDPGNASLRTLIKQTVEEIKNQVEKEKGGKKIKVKIIFEDKNEPCLAVPDYIAGVVRGYLQAENIEHFLKDDEQIPATLKRRYERIVGKIRLLNDYTRKKLYTRQTSMFIDSPENK